MFNYIVGKVKFRDGVVSGCCGEKVYLNTDICSSCKEHSELIENKETRILSGIEQLDKVLSGGISKNEFVVLYGCKGEIKNGVC